MNTNETNSDPRTVRQDSDSNDDNRNKLFTRAIIFARKGRYSEASAVLADLLRASKTGDPKVYHLLALINAQQGFLLNAEKYWMKALQLDPQNREYLMGIRKIRQIWHPLRDFNLAIITAVVLTALLVTFGFVSGGVQALYLSPKQDTTLEMSEISSEIDSITLSVADLEIRFNDLASQNLKKKQDSGDIRK
jgi:tetratricopeptide (TPR) repeat protein